MRFLALSTSRRKPARRLSHLKGRSAVDSRSSEQQTPLIFEGPRSPVWNVGMMYPALGLGDVLQQVGSSSTPESCQPSCIRSLRGPEEAELLGAQRQDQKERPTQSQ